MTIARLIAFDPGKRTAAWASFFEGKLVSAGMERWSDGEFPEALELRFRATPEWEPMRALVEYQQIYTSGPRRTRNPADVLSVTVTVGRILHALGPHIEAELVLPHAWKGSVPKEVMTRRIVSLLDKSERDIVHATKASAGELHNVVDAIGLGLHGLGRLRKK